MGKGNAPGREAEGVRCQLGSDNRAHNNPANTRQRRRGPTILRLRCRRRGLIEVLVEWKKARHRGALQWRPLPVPPHRIDGTLRLAFARETVSCR